MSVNQCTKDQATSKDNRWFYQFFYYDKDGKSRRYHSKKYAKKKKDKMQK